MKRNKTISFECVKKKNVIVLINARTPSNKYINRKKNEKNQREKIKKKKNKHLKIDCQCHNNIIKRMMNDEEKSK